MNIKYLPIEEKAYIANENDKIRVVQLTTNLDSQLDSENKIEMLENEIKKLDNQREKTKNEKIRNAILAIPAWCLFCLITFFLMYYILTAGEINLIDFISEKILIKISLWSGIVCGGIHAMSFLCEYFRIKYSLKRKDLQLFFMEKEIEKEQEHLKEIKREAVPKKQEKEVKEMVQVYDKSFLVEWEKYQKKLCLYAYKLQKYARRQTGIAKYNLDADYKEQLIKESIEPEIIEDYLEEYTKKRSITKGGLD